MNLRIIAMVAILNLTILSCESKNTGAAAINGTSESGAFPNLQIDSWNDLLGNTLSKSSDAKNNTFAAVALYFAEHREWLNRKALETIKEAGIPAYKLSDDPNVRELTLDGARHEIRVELYNHGQYKEKKNEGDFAVALDPDIFYPGASDLPAYFYDSKSGTVTEITIPVVLHSETRRNSKEREESKSKIKFPVYFVSLEDVEEYPVNLTEPSSLQKSSLVFQRYPYLALYSIKVKDDNEDGNMEFEVYHGNYDVDGDPHFDENGDHRFNGVTRGDAAGRSIYYPDINNKNQTYSMSPWIALQEVSSTYNYFMVPIENDIEPMKINIDGYSHDGVYSKSVQHFKMGTTSTTSTTMYFETAGQGWEPINYYSDDIYDEGGVSRMSRPEIGPQEE